MKDLSESVLMEEGIKEFSGRRVKELCARHGITPYQLSQLAEMKYANIKRYLDGENTPQLVTVEKICRVFGCSISEFFETFDEKEKPALTEEQNCLLARWQVLTEGERETLLTFADFMLSRR